MTEKKPREIKISGDSSSIYMAVILLFWMFWHQSGWYRVDCALGVWQACALISAEKEYQPGASK